MYGTTTPGTIQAQNPQAPAEKKKAGSQGRRGQELLIFFSFLHFSLQPARFYFDEMGLTVYGALRQT